MSNPTSDKFSRRALFKGSGAVAAATMVSANATAQDADSKVVSGESTVTLQINGKSVKAKVEPRTTLLEVLRYQLNLTGAKPVSLDGSSGASTVLVDGRPMMASTTLALSVVGKKIQTAESLAGDSVVTAFVDNDAQQCGFCTPGFVIAVRAFLNSKPNATIDEIRAGLNGNICRCGTYENILQAALSLVRIS